jgi:heptosyltransferase-1
VKRTGPRWLVIRFRAIGDNVLTAWAVTAIRDKFPDAHITWVTEKGFEAVLDTDHLVDELIVLDRKSHKQNRWNPASWFKQIGFYTQFRKMHYDYGVDFQGHMKTHILMALAKPRNRIAMWATDKLSKWLNPTATLSGDHRVEQFMSVINHLDSFNCPKVPLMPEVHYDLPQMKNVVSINTGASMPFKFVPMPVLQEVADQLSALGYFVVGIGGPNDPHLERVCDLCGKTSLKESLGVIRASACHVSGDTGTAHIAAAYEVPFVTCFVDLLNHPKVFRPYSDKGLYLMPEDVSVENIVRNVQEWAPLA